MFINIQLNNINFACQVVNNVVIGVPSNIQSKLQNLYNKGEFKETLQPLEDKLPDWIELKNRLLAGNLNPIFQRLTIASLAPDANTISTARGDITDAILTVKIEEALAAGFQLLTQIGNYKFTEEEKILWNTTISELGFSTISNMP